jgi:carbon-monoxide dehydrogenase large subunit
MVDYEPLEAAVTAEQSLAAPIRLHDGWPDNAALSVRGTVGNAEDALAGAAVVVSERLHHPRLAAVFIETRGALAYRDPDADGLVLWSSTQNPYAVRDAVARVLGLAPEGVRVRVPDVGGGFGPKGAPYPEEALVALAALRLDRPVKWVEGRREDFAATGHDREQDHEATIGLTDDGRIVAVDDRFLADVGAYPTQGNGLTMNTVNHLPGPYRVPHYRGQGTSVVTSKALNMAYPAAFARALGLIRYDDWRRRQREANASGVCRLGIGLACYAQGTGLGPFEGATVRVDAAGKVYVFIGVTAQGQGHGTTLAQIAATELGAAFDDVSVIAGDTALFPYGMGTGGSRVAANAGPAVARAAREVRSRASRVAAELLECAPEDIRIERGSAHVAGVPDRRVTLARLAQAAIRSKALKAATGEPGLHACTYFHPDTVTWAFGTHAAVVEVDVETAGVRLLAYAAVHDCGRAIHPAIVEGQLHGGAVQGIGAGLMEEVLYDDAGQLVTGTLMDYAVPRADQVPAIDVALLEHPSVINDLGIKGVGESGAIPGAAAIANAVEDAVGDLGVTIREVPVTAPRLWGLLAEARRCR